MAIEKQHKGFDLQGNKLTGLPDAINPSDAVRLSQLAAAREYEHFFAADAAAMEALFAAAIATDNTATSSNILTIPEGHQLVSMQMYLNSPFIVTGATDFRLVVVNSDVNLFLGGPADVLQGGILDSADPGYNGQDDYPLTGSMGLGLRKTGGSSQLALVFLTDVTKADITQWGGISLWIRTRKLS